MRRSAALLSLGSVLAAAVTASAPAALRAQAPEWNSERALELVGRARVLRRSTVVDPEFRSYRARAHGYVYFLLDRTDSDERTLVKADQVALEVMWQAPNQTRQRIIGLRDEKVLPTNIHYHLDHLTVVQDDFGDWIQLGDGDEVSRVLHPVGPGSQGIYDFRLADSLSIRYGDGRNEVRVYELQVRPKAPEMPGFIGSVFLDRESSAIVRMKFTFTAASYVDPYLDYIRISLDNSLWLEKYWLPYRQEAELRRELPQLDFLAGSIIRGRFEIGGYEFNPSIPEQTFLFPRVTAVSDSARRSFPFERGLFDDLAVEGLDPTPSLEEVRAKARQIVTDRALSGLSPLRLHVPSVSQALRYDRAEGLFLGGGLHVRTADDGLIRVGAGYAFGREAPAASVTYTSAPSPVVLEVRADWDTPADLGPFLGTAPVLSTLSTAVGGTDYRDLYFVRGLSLGIAGSPGVPAPAVTLRWERHESPENVLGGDARAVLPVDEGVLGALDVRLPTAAPAGGKAAWMGRLGRLGERSFAQARAHLSWSVDNPDGGRKLELDLHGGLSSADAPAQALWLLGGRGTLPGHGYRGTVGHAFWLARGVTTLPLRPPWLGLRLLAAAGGTRLASTGLPAGWAALGERALLGSVGAGISLGWDVLHVDASHGLGPSGSWEVSFSVTPRFHPWL